MRVVFFGCSHTVNFFPILYNNFLSDSTKFIHKSQSGNSNSKIIYDVYEFVNSNEFNSETDILSIQYTYTNRFWNPNILPKSQYSFHTLSYDGPIFKENPDFMRYELKHMYEVYIKYYWDYYLYFKDLIQKIDLLKSYLDSKKIKYVHYAWTDGGNSDEWNTIRGVEKIKKEPADLLGRFRKMNCLSIDRFDFISHWAEKNKLLKECGHLNDEGNLLFTNFLWKEILKNN